MKKIKAEILPITEMSQQDIQIFIDWVWKMRHLNWFDPQVLSYPRTVMCRADNGEEPLLYIPLQSVLMWDAIAPKPGLTPRQEAMCLWQIGEAVNQAMEATGHREAYFFTADDRVADICARHDFEELRGIRVLRRKAKPPISNPSTEAKE